jgi:protein SCO1/2
VRLAGALALLLACGGADAPGDAPAAAPATAEVDISPVVPLPPFTLTTQTGAPYTLAELRGHVTVVDFIFTSCPDVCPMLSAQMAELAKRYADTPDVRFLSISVDPATDTPAVLTTYAARFGADPARWTWLTGPERDVHEVVVAGFRSMMQRAPNPPGAASGAPAPRSAETVLHGERFVVVDRAGVIRGYPSPKEPGLVAAYVDAVRAEAP